MPSLLRELLFFLIGFVLLTAGAEVLVRGSSRLAARFRVPALIIGLTIVALGTSLPELLVTIYANLNPDGGGEIAIGNIVGSNIVNLGLVLALAGVLAGVTFVRSTLRRELPYVLLVTLVFILLAWDGYIGRIEGLLLLAGLVVFMWYNYSSARSEQRAHALESLDVLEAIDERIAQASVRPAWDLLLILLGLVGLVVGARWLVSSAESIARGIGVSDLVIGLTLVALGTSLPELAITIAAVVRKEADIAVGNVVGSNLFNMLAIGGFAAVVRPLSAPLHMRYFDLPFMLGLTVLTFLLVLRRPHRLVRWKGLVLLLIYITYLTLLFRQNGVPI